MMGLCDCCYVIYIYTIMNVVIKLDIKEKVKLETTINKSFDLQVFFFGLFVID